MIDSGWILPVQEYIEKDKYDISQIEPNIAAYYTVDNTLYSMPFNSSTPLLYYNKTAFEEAGITKVPTCFEDIYGIAAESEDRQSDGNGQALWLRLMGKLRLGSLNNGSARWCLHYVEQLTMVAGKDYATAARIRHQRRGGMQIIKFWDKILRKGSPRTSTWAMMMPRQPSFPVMCA
jgi:sn-glycerol 3-phosphate transport system substrate-binding protein